MFSKVKNILSIGLILLFGTACPEDEGHGDNRLTFINNSMQDVAVFLGYNYPDTSLMNEKVAGAAYTSWGVESMRQKDFWRSTDWDDAIRKRNNNHTLTIFVIDSDTIEAYDWEEIRAGYKISKRYELSIDDLRSSNWNVYYP